MLNVACRAPPALGATVNDTDPLPIPEGGWSNVTQLAPIVRQAAQAQPEPDVTDTVTCPPEAIIA